MWLRYEGLNMLTGPYAEEYDASLQAEYSPRDPLREFLLGEITLRQLRVLAQGLPETSALVRASRGHSWTDRDYILMGLANDMKWLRAEQAAIAAKKSPRKPRDLIKPPPEPDEIPSEEEEAQQQRRRAEFNSTVVAALFPNQ